MGTPSLLTIFRSVSLRSTHPTKPGAGGGTRTPTGLPPTDFRTSFGFRRPSEAQRAKAGSWSGLSLHPAPAPDASGQAVIRGLGAARLVSTPSRFRAWLGIAVERFPRVWAVLRPRFPAAHSKRSSPLRLPFRHARVARTAIPAPPGVAKAIPAARSRGAKKGIDKPIPSTI